jgi:hypothetical protein
MCVCVCVRARACMSICVRVLAPLSCGGLALALVAYYAHHWVCVAIPLGAPLGVLYHYQLAQWRTPANSIHATHRPTRIGSCNPAVRLAQCIAGGAVLARGVHAEVGLGSIL